MKIVIIGGTGHIGSFLVPRLVLDGHEVISLSRLDRKPYFHHVAWESVRQISINREIDERENKFADKILRLQPDVVIDLICFELQSARTLVDMFRGEIQHFLHCGTIWVHGYSELVPTKEEQARKPFGAYGIKKAAIEKYLIAQANTTGFPASIIHPGHIVGPGWMPLNPAGHFNPDVFEKLANGHELILPNLGMETVHHVHANDVAQAFHQAIIHRNNALGESFHIVSEQALTLRGYAAAMGKWFGKEAKLAFEPWEEWQKTVTIEEARITWDHISHSPNCSIEKAKKKIAYNPRYSSLQAVQESVNILFDQQKH